MAKAFDDETNERLRAIARKRLVERYKDKQAPLAAELSVTGSFLSDFLSGNKGAGLDMLRGLARFAPLEVLTILGVEPGVIVTLLEGRHEELEAGLALMPEIVRRAARAAVELEGCSPGAAGDAAVWCFDAHGAVPDTDVDWWLTKIRKRLAETAKSGERQSEKLRNARSSRG